MLELWMKNNVQVEVLEKSMKLELQIKMLYEQVKKSIFLWLFEYWLAQRTSFCQSIFD